MSLLSPPYSSKLTLEGDSRISFKSSFSLQGTGRWRNGEQLHFLSPLCPFLLFFFLFFPASLTLPLYHLNWFSSFKLHWYLDDSYKYISSPEHFYWELQILASNQIQVMSSSCVQNGTLSNGTLHHFWTSSKWDHHWFEPFFNQKSRFYPWFILLYLHCIHSNGKFHQFYCKAYCKSISFSVPIATNLVKKTAVSQLDYSLSLWHINICSPQSILHKKNRRNYCPIMTEKGSEVPDGK